MKGGGIRAYSMFDSYVSCFDFHMCHCNNRAVKYVEGGICAPVLEENGTTFPAT